MKEFEMVGMQTIGNVDLLHSCPRHCPRQMGGMLLIENIKLDFCNGLYYICI